MCHMTRVTWESKYIAIIVKCISSRELSKNSIKFSLSNSEQRDSWLNSGHQTLDANILGSLMWLQVATQPNIFYAVTLLSHFAHNPEKSYWSKVKHVLTYIKGTLDYRITYRADGELSSTGYVDSDFAECKDTCCSTEGNIFIVTGEPILWESKRQETVVLSTVKAEYMGFLRTATQAL